MNAYERPETAFVQTVLKPGDLAVDAGANIGYFAMLFASIVGENGSVEAFEPLPYLARCVEGERRGERVRYVRNAALDRVSSERTVDVHVRRLRLHLGEDAHLLRTMTQIGYRLDSG